MRKIIQLFLICFFSIFSATRAEISIGQNHPELSWSFHQTPHFKIIYHQGAEKLAGKAAIIAEEVWGPITTDLGVKPSREIAIIISDYDDLSNGLATPLGHSIFIWAQSFTKYTTGNMNWLRRVIAHELTHQIHYLSQQNLFGTPWELFSLGTTSTWFTEGLAQYEAERWDAHRDMLLKVAARSNALLSRKRLEGFLGGDVIHFRLVYEQGHSLVRYIAEKYGADKIKIILQKQRQFPASFNLALKRAIGISEAQLIREWQAQVQEACQIARKGQENLIEKYSPFQNTLQANYGLRWSPDGKFAAVVGIETFDEFATRLYLFNTNGKFLKTIDGPEIGAFFSWSPDGSKIVYSKRRKGKNGSLLKDLMLYDLKSGSKTTLTQNLRATDPVWSPDGKQIVFCQHQGPYSNLVMFHLEKKKFTPLKSFGDWTEVFAPSWHPDGSQIAFSFVAANGWRNIATITTNGRETALLTNDSTDARTPVWSPDGQKLAFISYKTGQPNLFVRDFSTNETFQLSQVYGGLFNPTWTQDGSGISVVAFEQRDSIHVFTLPVKQLQPLPSVNTQPTFVWHQTIPPNAAPEQLNQNSNSTLFHPLENHEYHSIFHVRPHLTLPNFDYDDHGLQFGVYNQSADPLGKHLFAGTMTGGKRLHFAANYTNTQFLPLINLFISQDSYNRGTFQGLELWEKGFRSSLSFQIPFNFGQNLYANHLLWLRGEAFRITNYDPTQYQNFYSWAQPFTGWINAMTFGYAYSTGRPSTTYNIHPDAGFQLSLLTKRADSHFGSDLTFNQYSASTVIRRRAWFRRHILALKFGWFLHDGQQRIQSRYAMGRSMIRGLTPSIEGSQMLSANLDYRFPVISDLGLKIWFVYFEGLFGGGFFDVGKVWGQQMVYSRQAQRYVWIKNAFNKKDPVGSFGAELRLRIYLAGKIAVIIKGGLAKRWDNLSDETKYYYLIGPVF